MTEKEKALKIVAGLVARFEEQYESYNKVEYNETLARRDFIDPFFKALGWDVDNTQGYAESYREVIHEERVKIAGATKAPDYSFRLAGGKRLFFVEAKKPATDIKENEAAAYQIRRYGWSAKLPVSIITNFAEFSVYDCTPKPKPTDKAFVARIKYLTFRDYVSEFDFIWDTFSKEQVLKGSFDRFVQSDTSKKGTATVDKEFLLSLDKWREYLATSVSLNNRNLTVEEINFVVHQIIDRIIFLRIAEDRQLEHYGTLKICIKQGNYYQNLYELFTEANEKYNSGLFDFSKDLISKDLKIDNKVIKNIITELYYPESPYEFSVLSVEILGSAYERYLGKTIVLDASHKARIEDKFEVRKAGGVFYTPQYIVDYIVENTIGKLIEGKTPTEISKLKIVDPACGSGSFLLGAYQYLLDYHKDYYTQKGKLTQSKIKKGNKEYPLTPDGQLSTSEKKRILVNNIYGVDLDANAVEVTKLSLLLKCLEGETQASVERQVKLFRDRVLPDLDDNIKCGNSLIDTDFYEGVLDLQADNAIKPFNWQRNFPDVFKQGGFDVIIGNPPYVRIQLMAETQPDSLPYFKEKYTSASSGNYDLYALFVEKAHTILNEKGRIGFILPHKFFQADFGLGLRRFLSKKKSIIEIIDFGVLQVFEGATTYTCLLFLSKQKIEKIRYIKVNSLDNIKELFDALIINKHNIKKLIQMLPQPSTSDKWSFGRVEEIKLIEKLKNIGIPLENYTEKIFQGIPTGADDIFILSFLKNKGKNTICYSKSLDKEVALESEVLVPFLMGKDVKRYQIPETSKLLLFPYILNQQKPTLLSKGDLSKFYPLAWEYFNQNKKMLSKRENGRFADTFWQFSRPQNLSDFFRKKILMPHLGAKPELTIDFEGKFSHTANVYSFIFNNETFENELYFLGILNSKLLFYYELITGTRLRGGYINFKPTYIKPFPVKKINFNNKKEVDRHDKIVEYVKQLLTLYPQKLQIKIPSKSSQLQEKIDFCEKRIDQLIYELYQLTDEEIKIVEEVQ